MFSPHTWGCFVQEIEERAKEIVLPTYVGVFPPTAEDFQKTIGSPHIRGGVSHLHLGCLAEVKFSPHTWGCFLCRVYGAEQVYVLPTYVGVFLDSIRSKIDPKSSPHIRGGVSYMSVSRICAESFSPHTWGCFHILSIPEEERMVLPTYVGVFLWGCFPSSVTAKFSPRVWGCLIPKPIT